MHQQQTAFENMVGKLEIARNKQFLLFPQCFLINQLLVSPFVHIFHRSLLAAELEEPKVGISGKPIVLLYRRKLHIRGLTFDELLNSIMGFTNPGNVQYLLDSLKQGEESSMMRGLHR